MRFAIARSRFNEPITLALLGGAKRAFADAKVPERSVEVVEVPGAFELPVAALWLAKTKKFDAVICLGCVIRGETPHFDYIAGEAARGIGEAAVQTGVPVIFGVLTTDNAEQAWARAGQDGAVEARSSHRAHLGEPAQTNKGYEAAQSAIAMAKLKRRVHEHGRGRRR
jgi:6,7-dimethyl-8-ribityllumazine synthase